jgi:hypothetical protein
MNILKNPGKFICFLLLNMFCGLPMSGAAEETSSEYLTAEEYIEQAAPYLHFSCEGAWNSVAPDAEEYINIVNKLGAIGFINHDFDVGKMEILPEEQMQELRVDYYNEIGRLCRENPSLLLAGVVERALVDAFRNLPPAGATQ